MTKRLNEITSSADTLRPKSRPHDDIEVINKAIARILQLNNDQVSRHLDMVQRMLDSAFGKPPIPDGTAEKNREFNKEELEAVVEEMGFTEEAKQKAAELFLQLLKSA
jgi:hypothetical protein